jgi:hypothetical protein
MFMIDEREGAWNKAIVEQFSRQLMGETEENQEKSLKTHSFLTDI